MSRCDSSCLHSRNGRGSHDSHARDFVACSPSLGVKAASTACCMPLESVWQLPFVVQGRPLTGPFHAFAGWTFVSPGYFDVLKIPIVRGRDFTERDDASAPGVVI